MFKMQQENKIESKIKYSLKSKFELEWVRTATKQISNNNTQTLMIGI